MPVAEMGVASLVSSDAADLWELEPTSRRMSLLPGRAEERAVPRSIMSGDQTYERGSSSIA